MKMDKYELIVWRLKVILEKRLRELDETGLTNLAIHQYANGAIDGEKDAYNKILDDIRFLEKEYLK